MVLASAPGTDMRSESDVEGGFHLTDRDFKRIVAIVRESTNIHLTDAKRNLVYGRLSRRLRSLRVRNFDEYCALLESPAGEAEREMMINAITTNLTGFFREQHHFDFLKTKILTVLRDHPPPNRRLRIWSAGCSSGEEPYSIAMTLRASIPLLDRWDARILATDIDTDMVEHGAAGSYDQRRAAAIPDSYRRLYTEDQGDGVKMTEALQSLIAFKPLNLFDPWPMSGKFDVIFCRNVVIYFDKSDQRILFDRFAEILAPGGWLFIGHSESLFRVSDRFKHLGRTIYQKAG
jgi:chemotaxis protein methyltransferase CheR